MNEAACFRRILQYKRFNNELYTALGTSGTEFALTDLQGEFYTDPLTNTSTQSLVQTSTPEISNTDTKSVLDCLTFFDSKQYFLDSSIIRILKCLSTSSLTNRKIAFEAYLSCRCRDQPTLLNNSRVNKVFIYETEKELIQLKQMSDQISAQIQQQYTSIAEAFNVFDSNKDTFISLEEFEIGIEQNLRVTNYTKEQIQDLFAYTDLNGDSFLSFREFSTQFHAREKEDNEDTISDGLKKMKNKIKSKNIGKSDLHLENKESNTGILATLASLEASKAVSNHTVTNSKELIFLTQHPKARSGGLSDLSLLGSLFPIQGDHALFQADNTICSEDNYKTTISLRGVSISKGIWYYEIVIVKPGKVVVGWYDMNMLSSNNRNNSVFGVGTIQNSFGFDISTGSVLSNSISKNYTKQLEVGEVLGCLFNIDNRQMNFSVNRQWITSETVISSNDFTMTEQTLFCPAITYESTSMFRVNFGDIPFRNIKPQNSFSLRHFIREKHETICAIKSGDKYGTIKATSGNTQLKINKYQLECLKEFPTATLQGCLITKGRYYYEFEIVTDGVCQIGWADLQFVASTKEGVGTGDDKKSFGYDGNRQLLWSNGRIPCGVRWRVGDIIGCAADLETRTLRFSSNGSWAKPMGILAENIEILGGLTPSFTLSPPAILKINLGQEKFKFSPPDTNETYLSVWNWLLEHAPSETIKNTLINTHPSTIPDSAIFKLEEDKKSDEEIVSPPPISMQLFRTHSSDTRHLDFETTDKITLRTTSGFAKSLIDDNNNIISSTGSYPSIIANNILITKGKYIYEVIINQLEESVSDTEFALGYGNSLFQGSAVSNTGVGQDNNSWAIHFAVVGGNRARVTFQHDSQSIPFVSLINTETLSKLEEKTADKPKLPQALKIITGDVINVALDLEANAIHIAINGYWILNCFSGTIVNNLSRGLIPAFSIGKKVKLQVNFGEEKFQYPLLEGFTTVKAHNNDQTKSTIESLSLTTANNDNNAGLIVQAASKEYKILDLEQVLNLNQRKKPDHVLTLANNHLQEVMKLLTSATIKEDIKAIKASMKPKEFNKLIQEIQKNSEEITKKVEPLKQDECVIL